MKLYEPIVTETRITEEEGAIYLKINCPSWLNEEQVRLLAAKICGSVSIQESVTYYPDSTSKKRCDLTTYSNHFYEEEK